MKTRALLLSLVIRFGGAPSQAEGEIVTGPDRRDEIDLRALDLRIEELDAEIAAISTKGLRTATFAGLGLMVVGGADLPGDLRTTRYLREWLLRGRSH